MKLIFAIVANEVEDHQSIDARRNVAVRESGLRPSLLSTTGAADALRLSALSV